MYNSDSSYDFEGFSFEEIEQHPLFDGESDVESDVDLGSDVEDHVVDSIEKNDWKKSSKPITIHDFVGKSGPTNDLPTDSQPTDYFDELVTTEFFELLVAETNRYADFQLKSKPSSKWKDVNIIEMRCFIGIMMLMGYNILPGINEYWSENDSTANNRIRKSMSRDRFKQILKNIHLTDPQQKPSQDSANYDKLFKVRPMITSFSKSFEDAFDPPRDISIDEGMVKFKGRLGFVQYMPQKPTKRGVKVWMAAGAHTGYVHNFEVYTGKNSNEPHSTGLGSNVVLRLTRNLTNSYRHIYFDNFFSSVDLALQL